MYLFRAANCTQYICILTINSLTGLMLPLTMLIVSYDMRRSSSWSTTMMPADKVSPTAAAAVTATN